MRKSQQGPRQLPRRQLEHGFIALGEAARKDDVGAVHEVETFEAAAGLGLAMARYAPADAKRFG